MGTLDTGTVRPKVSASSALAASPRSIGGLRSRAAACTACPLYGRATQTVFGEGPARAKLMIVGEQPGDEEDREGHPFVGPAGRYLDKCLDEAGIDRNDVYLTNVVKHFKWVPQPRGKRRIHSKPNAAEILACRGWLEAEIRIVSPDTILCLGATAAQAFQGRRFSVLEHRGKILRSPDGARFLATYHPSAILRMPTSQDRAKAKALFLEDLRRAAT
ncbi:MAG: UdgX family uracil-DNA binding protein [Polyangiaceae bacterium]|nr:UdgX family uracil-DNA binding protein [Polyangiaceae bacterium]